MHVDMTVEELAAVIQIVALPIARVRFGSISTTSLHRPWLTRPNATVDPTVPAPTTTTLFRFIVTIRVLPSIVSET